jgi:peptide/nickel transport system substrate-binding protein
MKKKINRRDFLRLSAMSVGSMVLAACATQTATEVMQEEMPEATATEVPMEEQAAEATPTPRVIEEATATPVPEVMASKEAPMLAEMVAAGTLPPLEERLPVNPLTLSPVNTIGQYGGRIRTLWPDPGWNGHFLEQQYGHSPLRWIDDGLGIAPGICEAWESNADNSEWTLHFREGLKWSDGEPCTVDDVLFWWDYNTVKGDPGYPDAIPDFGQDANGDLVEWTRVDDFTLKMTYGTPAPLTAKRLAMWVNANIGPRFIVPQHYMEQFHPAFSDATDFELYNQNLNVFTNPDCPTLTAWMCTEYEAGVKLNAERNPYYYCVDTEGNQLPYIDGMDGVVVDDPQTQLLQVRQGSIDHLHFHDFALSDISTLLDNQDAGNYDVLLWDSGSGTGECYFWNYDHPDDKYRELWRTPEFKQAMSFAVDRETIKRVIYYDTGILTTGTMSPKAFEFNFNAEAQDYYQKARTVYMDYDPDTAMSMLDNIGCTVGADGYRTFPDGSPLELRLDFNAATSQTKIQVNEIVSKNFEDIGLKVVLNSMTGTDFDQQWQAGQLDIFANSWEVGDGPDHLLYPSWVVPNEPARWAPLCGRKLQFEGTSQEDSEADVSPWDRQPPRFNSNDPQYMGSAVEQIHDLYRQAIIEPDEIKRADLVYDMWDIHIAQGPFFIGTVANYPRIIIASRNMENVPRKDQLRMGGFVNPWIIPYPAVTNMETWSFKTL